MRRSFFFPTNNVPRPSEGAFFAHEHNLGHHDNLSCWDGRRGNFQRDHYPPHATYGIVYGMKKTTVYLPDDLKAALERAAVDRGRSEADLIREAVRELTRNIEPPRPRLPLFSSGDPTLAERVDEELQGFGES